MHEIITLQFGQRANYLATHFWNTQESYFTYSSDQESLVDHDRHFRPGMGADGSETFTPRTVIYDLKGGFGSLKKINALYELDDPSAPEGLWNGPAIVQRQDAIQRNAYQQSIEEGLVPAKLTTESVRYWSDFNRVYLHPKSIVQLNESDLGSALMPFENWSAGDELFSSLDKEHDILDRDLRPFAEEADQMQGIQLISSTDDAWGGFSARYMDRLRDEYSKTSIWFWGIEDEIGTIPRENRILQHSNIARTISEITLHASLFVPMTLPSTLLSNHVTLDPRSQWHTSGLFSTALESMTLPTRLKAARETLDQLASTINLHGNQNIAKLRMGIDQKTTLNGTYRSRRIEDQDQDRELRVHSQKKIAEWGNPDEYNPTTFPMDFFPMESTSHTRGPQIIKKPHVFSQVEVYRGDQDERSGDGNAGCERARQRAEGLPIIHKSRTSLNFPLLDSFPRIFMPQIELTSISVSASLSADTTVASRIKTLQQATNRGIGLEEREALGNSLGEIAESYEQGWDSFELSDDDE